MARISYRDRFIGDGADRCVQCAVESIWSLYDGSVVLEMLRGGVASPELWQRTHARIVSALSLPSPRWFGLHPQWGDPFLASAEAARLMSLQNTDGAVRAIADNIGLKRLDFLRIEAAKISYGSVITCIDCERVWVSFHWDCDKCFECARRPPIQALSSTPEEVAQQKAEEATSIEAFDPTLLPRKNSLLARADVGEVFDIRHATSHGQLDEIEKNLRPPPPPPIPSIGPAVRASSTNRRQ